MNELEKARIDIDSIDKEMVKLFEKRMETVTRVAKYKKENSMPIFDSKREDKVIEKNVALLENKELTTEYTAFIKEMMNVSKLYQRKSIFGKKVGYQGIRGAFSHIAALHLFEGTELINYATFGEVLDAIENNEIDCGVLPIENSNNGEVGEVMDGLFRKKDLYICAYYDLKVDQNLLGIPGTKVDSIKKVYSHQQALGQCSNYLKSLKAEQIPYSNTAKAAEYVANSGSNEIAAIASAKTAELYGLEILEQNINNSDSNTTRFAIVSKQNNSHGDKFGLFFVVSNTVGSLVKAVEAISNTGLNMTCLRSRALKDLPWEYYFYAEVSGDIADEKCQKMLEELKKICQSVRVLGSFQKID